MYLRAGTASKMAHSFSRSALPLPELAATCCREQPSECLWSWFLCNYFVFPTTNQLQTDIRLLPPSNLDDQQQTSSSLPQSSVYGWLWRGCAIKRQRKNKTLQIPKILLDANVNLTNKKKHLQACISPGFHLPGSSILCEILSKKSQQRNAWQTRAEEQMHKHWCCYLFFIHTVLLTHFAEDSCHLKRPCGVHVGSNYGDASVGLFGVAECEGPLKVHLQGTGSE